MHSVFQVDLRRLCVAEVTFLYSVSFCCFRQHFHPLINPAEQFLSTGPLEAALGPLPLLFPKKDTASVEYFRAQRKLPLKVTDSVATEQSVALSLCALCSSAEPHLAAVPCLELILLLTPCGPLS